MDFIIEEPTNKPSMLTVCFTRICKVKGTSLKTKKSPFQGFSKRGFNNGSPSRTRTSDPMINSLFRALVIRLCRFLMCLAGIEKL